jgi:hypothetical protein
MATVTFQVFETAILNLLQSYSKEILSDVKGSAGTYAFYSKELDDYYIGVSIVVPRTHQDL